MATIPLTLHGLTWCWRHGHPIVGLQSDAEQVFWVTLAPDDAQALSPMYQGHNTGRSRVYELLESMLDGLGARITSVAIEVGPSGILRGRLTIESMVGMISRPVHTVDAIVLAQRGQLPIGIDEQDLTRICPPDPAKSAPEDDLASDWSHEPPDSFRAFIESLDLGQLDQPTDS